MAGENNPAENAAGSAEIAELKGLVGTLAASLSTLVKSQSDLVKNVDVIAQTIAKSPPAKKVEGDEAKPLSADDIKRLMKEERDAAAQETGAKQARDSYASEKLKDLPAVYRDKLGSDATKWPTEEQSLREQFKADMKSAGIDPASLGNANKDGGDAQIQGRTVIDKSKLDPLSRITMGLKAKTTTPAAAAV